jgi:hypothetical protein
VSFPEETARTKTTTQLLLYFNKKVDRQFWLTSIRDYFNNTQATADVLSIYSQNEDLLFTIKKDTNTLKQCLGILVFRFSNVIFIFDSFFVFSPSLSHL